MYYNKNGGDSLNDKNYDFSNYLKEMRSSKKMTLVELAKKAGTSNSYLSQIENMKRNPPKPDMLKNIAAALSNGDENEAKIIYDALMEKAGNVLRVPVFDENSKLFKDIRASIEADKIKVVLDEILNYDPLSIKKIEVILKDEPLIHEEILALQLLLKGILSQYD